MNNYKSVSLILAGGTGSRFWPLSRAELPKQVLNITGNDIMINETIKRCSGIIDFNDSYIATSERQLEILDKSLVTEIPRINIFAEPVSRNTAPCILYAALKLRKIYGEAVMCVFPSDHYITDDEKFRLILKNAIELASDSECLITLGIKPTFPATGYGYINFDSDDEMKGAFRVSEFVEKPDYIRADRFIGEGTYLWNSGMFVWKISTILNSFKRFLPRVYNKISELDEYIGSADEKEKLYEIYPKVQKISIDYGIMERADDVFVFPADIGWNDIGSWDALGTVFPPDESGNILRTGDNVIIESKNNIIYSEKQLVSTIDIHDMIIVSTDDALMVCPKSKAQSVREIVEQLEKRGMKEYL